MTNKQSIMDEQRPRSISLAVKLWFFAIFAGIFETCLVLYDAIIGGHPQDGLVLGVLVRVALFAIMSWFVIKMGRGKNWARITLTIVLGVLGSLSLLIGPVEWLQSGHNIADALNGITVIGLLFFVSRSLHVLAVWTGVVCMFTPTAKGFFGRKPSGKV